MIKTEGFERLQILVLFVPLTFPALIGFGRSQFPYWILLSLIIVLCSKHRVQDLVVGLFVGIVGGVLLSFGENSSFSVIYGLLVSLIMFWAVYFSRFLEPQLVVGAVRLSILISILIGSLELLVPGICSDFGYFNSVRNCSGRPSAFYNEPSHIAFLLAAFLCCNYSQVGWKEKTLISGAFCFVFPSGTVLVILVFFLVFRFFRSKQGLGLFCCWLLYYSISFIYLELRQDGWLIMNQSWDKRTLFLISSTLDWTDWIIPSVLYDPTPLYTGFYPELVAVNPELTPDVLSEGVYSFSLLGAVLQTLGGLGVLVFLSVTKKVGSWGFAVSLLVLGYPASLFTLAVTWALCRNRHTYRMNHLRSRSRVA